jgi:hypothetical protein
MNESLSYSRSELKSFFLSQLGMKNIFLSFCTIVRADLDWTQYSDRAALPMSKNARDRMRDSLESIDRAKLSVKHLETYDQLNQALREDLDSQNEADEELGMELLLVPLIFLVAASFIYRASMSSQINRVNMDETRDARLKKFT